MIRPLAAGDDPRKGPFGAFARLITDYAVRGVVVGPGPRPLRGLGPGLRTYSALRTSSGALKGPLEARRASGPYGVTDVA